ncbi:hypothetical protein CIHG_08936 [Coccidioides immitis H538.4]|uniref:Uncharacterized protein n=1 Tax=Coccidioides immitis H538.4 TaxID=396776 RepID=A0A0J8S221_COCIT|nr:hypothetical protein CIHG_08936 [Coccidioides immitis H538.4]
MFACSSPLLSRQHDIAPAHLSPQTLRRLGTGDTGYLHPPFVLEGNSPTTYCEESLPPTQGIAGWLKHPLHWTRQVSTLVICHAV